MTEIMRAFLEQHHFSIGTVGATTSVVSGFMGFLSVITPILQCVALVVSITAGVLTIVHFLRSR